MDGNWRRLLPKQGFSVQPHSAEQLLQQSSCEQLSDTESVSMSSTEDKSHAEEEVSSESEAYDDNVCCIQSEKLDQTDADCKQLGSGDVDHEGSIQSESLVTVVTSPPPTRSPDESDQEYARRLRKHNYLSLAQEFVDRKAAQEEAYQSLLNSGSCDSSVDSVECSKNKRNSEKSCSDGSSKSGSLKCLYPMPQEVTANHNAIHHHHQRSLVTYESCLRNSQEVSEHLITSPTHAIPRRLSSTRSLAPRSEIPSKRVSNDLPANVARMVTFCPPANATYHLDGNPFSRSNAAPLNSVDRRPNRAARHSYHDNNYRAFKGGSSSQSKIENEVITSAYSEDGMDRFDVYNIETTLPAIDWSAMEENLSKAAKEQDIFQKHHRSNREEIRRKLALGSDNEDYYGGERMGRKPSLQTRLQSGMNLQICFMNEMVGDQEVYRGTEQAISSKQLILSPPNAKDKDKTSLYETKINSMEKPSAHLVIEEEKSGDFISKQTKLQAEARLALAQAKQMAHMQMEVEKQRKKKSPIAEMVGIPFPDGRRKVSRQALSEMNVAQLQVIVNDLHTQIESLNEDLVHMLLERDDLHMEQDSMLVDIEDLTRYVGAKDHSAVKEVGHDKLPLPRLKTKKKFLLK